MVEGKVASSPEAMRDTFGKMHVSLLKVHCTLLKS